MHPVPAVRGVGQTERPFAGGRKQPVDLCLQRVGGPPGAAQGGKRVVLVDHAAKLAEKIRI